MRNQLEGYARELSKAESFDQALDMLADITAHLGYTQVLYAYQPMASRFPDGEWLPLKLNVRNFPKGWEQEWESFGSHDPYYRACFDGTLPIDWLDVQHRESLHPTEQKAWRFLADLGLARGITTPIHLPFGRFAVVSAILDRSGGNWSHIRNNTRETMFHLTHLFHNTIHEHHFETQVETARYARLSPRETECLQWAAAGKTSPEVARIIDRSVETVRLHLKNAIHKLRANNKPHAIAKAMQLGLIQPISRH